MKKIRAALLGNPNASTADLFNLLTNSNPEAAFCAGLKIEEQTETFHHKKAEIELTNLPGVYGLSPTSLEEKVVIDYLLEKQPDVLVNVLDPTNLERNLYLTTQLAELGIPMLLTMHSTERGCKNGHKLNLEIFSEQLGGLPIVETCDKARSTNGHSSIEQLKELLASSALYLPRSRPVYSDEIETALTTLEEKISTHPDLAAYPQRWLALHLLEGSEDLPDHIKPDGMLAETVSTIREKLTSHSELDIEIEIANQRFNFIHRIVDAAQTQTANAALTLSDRVDQFATHRLLGVPIFLVVMYLLFNLVRSVSDPYLNFIDSFFQGQLTRWLGALLALTSAPAWLESLVLDGVLTSVGGVLVFVPSLFAMHFLLAALENSGYLARAAFVMDRFMSKVGLHGKSFIPMILGFGCNVPAIYATRTIEKREARLLTGLLIPFMSCSARLPVYLIFGLAFFPERANLVIFILYLLGIFVAAGIALLISNLLFKDSGPGIMVMELSPYRLPRFKPIFRYAWGQTADFVKNAGTVIMVFSMALWLALNLPWGTTNPQKSIYGQFSTLLAPTLAPPGFGEWEKAGALVTGMIAKEMVISSLAQVYHIPQENAEQAPESFWSDLVNLGTQFGQATLETGQALLETLTPGIHLFRETDAPGEGNLALTRALQSAFTPLSAASFLVFVLLYVPCVATVSAQRQEFGNQWAALSVAITLLVPWIMATIVFQTGKLLGFS